MKFAIKQEDITHLTLGMLLHYSRKLKIQILVGLGHRSKFQRVLRLGFVTAPTSFNGRQPNFARCLVISLAATLYIHFWGSCPLTEFCQMQHSHCVQSLAFSYIGSVTARYSSSVRQPDFAACYKEETFAPRLRHPYSAGRPSR